MEKSNEVREREKRQEVCWEPRKGFLAWRLLDASWIDDWGRYILLGVASIGWMLIY